MTDSFTFFGAFGIEIFRKIVYSKCYECIMKAFT